MTRVLFAIHHHPSDTPMTRERARLALDCGADGILLVGGDTDAVVLDLAAQLRQSTAPDPARTVGVALLSTAPVAAYEKAAGAGLDALWIHSPGITSMGVSAGAQKLADVSAAQRKLTLFASVAYQYEPDEADPARAAGLACGLGMLPTTSGPRADVPPSLEKILSMNEAAAGQLAAVCPMDVRSARALAPYLSHILVEVAAHASMYEPQVRGFIAAVRQAARPAPTSDRPYEAALERMRLMSPAVFGN